MEYRFWTWMDGEAIALVLLAFVVLFILVGVDALERTNRPVAPSAESTILDTMNEDDWNDARRMLTE